MKAFWAMFIARNKEFYRDRAGLGWNIIFPFLIIAGFAAIFGRSESPPYMMGVVVSSQGALEEAMPEGLAGSRFFTLVPFQNRDEALAKLSVHKLDIVIQPDFSPVQYWISDTSPKGAQAGEIAAAALIPQAIRTKHAQRQSVEARRIHYIDWLFPGILAMNMMFSALFGVGFVVVRYRKNQVLKRLAATPLTAFQFLSAHIASRIMVIMASTALVYVVCALMFDFTCLGSLLTLGIVVFLGGTAHISLALLMAARSANEEFTSGILNFILWPMMFLSEVWFSLEGSPEWVKAFSKLLPLTHVTHGMRAVMNQGSGMGQLHPHIIFLAGFTIVFLVLGSWRFKWTEN